jgi:hypothetical protein
LVIVHRDYPWKQLPFSLGKELMKCLKEFIVIRLFGSEEKPFLLPFYVSDKLFVKEMCRQYKTWAHFFHDKRKKQFIPLPWKIGKFTVKHITHLNELAGHHEQLGLKEAKFVEGFDPDNKFTAHMELVGYSSHFTKIEQFQEGGRDNLDLHEMEAYQVSNDTGEINNTNEGHRQHDREVTNQNPNSPTTSQRSTPSRTKNKTSGMETRKTSVGGSDDGGDKDPPRKNLEKSHITYTPVKRKRNTSSTGLSIPEVQESPRAMDMDELIEEPSWSAQRLLETREIVDAMITQDPKIFEEESVTLHHVAYNRETKKLLLEKVNTKNKRSSERWKYSIDFDGVAP